MKEALDGDLERQDLLVETAGNAQGHVTAARSLVEGFEGGLDGVAGAAGVHRSATGELVDGVIAAHEFAEPQADEIAEILDPGKLREGAVAEDHLAMVVDNDLGDGIGVEQQRHKRGLAKALKVGGGFQKRGPLDRGELGFGVEGVAHGWIGGLRLTITDLALDCPAGVAQGCASVVLKEHHGPEARFRWSRRADGGGLAPMPPDPFRVAMIGCGKRAQAMARGLTAEPRCQVVALTDLKQEAAAGLDQSFGFGAAVFTDHRRMLAEVKPDVVVASLWTPLHLPVFRDCAEAGVKAVLSEKPMAPTWGEALEMARIAESSGCRLTFCHQRRFCEGNRAVRRLLAEGRFGKILAMDLYSPCCLLDCGTHTFDQALSFNNESPAKWVHAAVDASEVKLQFGVPAEKMLSALVVFENGVRAWMQSLGPDRDMPTGLRIHATNGLLEVGWDGQIGRAHVFDDPAWRPPELPAPEQDAAMAGVVRDTIDGLATGKEPELSHQKALRATEIIFACYESAATHRRVELPLTRTDNAFTTVFGERAPGASGA